MCRWHIATAVAFPQKSKSTVLLVLPHHPILDSVFVLYYSLFIIH